MITPGQIRAARALIGWSQAELAHRAQVTQVTIANVETQKTQASRQTIEKIEAALESQGVEFIGNGVRHRDHYLNHYVGDDAYIRLLDDVYFTLKENKGEVLFMGVDERKNHPGVADCVRRMKASGIRLRLLIEEGNDYILGDLNDYRQIPSEYFSNGVTLTYGNKYAIGVVLADESRVHVVSNSLVADAQRRIFQFLWDRAKKPEYSAVNAQY